MFIGGSGNNDEWFFDYQAGVLHFIGTNLPNGVNFTGKSVYITGARYIGNFGVGAAAGEDTSLANLTASGTTLGTANAGDDIIIQPTGSGVVDVDTNTSLIIPVGTATTPTPTKDIIVPNILPPSVKGKISLNPTPVKDETAHQKDSVILENC